ncbi:MAG: hypothetical protein Q7T82_02710 [Armatimonadota bacterium]|nr:hypothetical protein [Armatimonadota bacterium]
MMALGYDVYQLLNTKCLSRRTLNRLRQWDGFQGARYEMAVAAMFCRLQWRLDYPRKNQQGRRPEFVATHGPTGPRIAVEAKSRHRSGVLHQPVTASAVKATTKEAGDLLEQALEQLPPDLPAAVFIDLNAPPGDPGDFDVSWWVDMAAMMKRFGEPTPHQPDCFNAVFVTNYSYHYYTVQESPRGQSMFVASTYPRHSFPAELMTDIVRAVGNYGVLPDERF